MSHEWQLSSGEPRAAISHEPVYKTVKLYTIA